jgi:methionyl-tRNA formyltransferase
VIAHPPDPEDGVVYESVYEHARSTGLDVIRAKGTEPCVEMFLRKCRPDLLWIADYRYLLPPALLDIPPLGTVNIHPSLLPAYRGRAPVNWAILRGETMLGATVHYVDKGMDSGDIIEQRSFLLDHTQDVSHAIDILEKMYPELTARVLDQIRAGTVAPRRQDHSQATEFPARKPADGQINWQRPAVEVVNLVRAVTRPYPGAFTYREGDKLMVLKVVLCETERGGQPGMVLFRDENRTVVACGDGAVRLIDTSWDRLPVPRPLSVGDLLGRSSERSEGTK